jgi:hypothetical protein
MFLLSTSSLGGYGLHRIFDFAKKGGFEGIDLSVDFGAFDTFDATYIDGLIQGSDMPVVSITAPERKL